MPVLNASALIDTLVGNIRRLHTDSGIPRAELDLSGGIDSAVMLGLLVLAVGRENITTIHLAINSNPVAYARAKALANAVGVPLINFDGTPLFTGLLTSMKSAMADAGYSLDEIDARIANDPTILGSIRSTLRAPWGRAANRLTGGGVRHGTGNEDEDRWLRFYQKGGDGEVDTNPIAMLSKGEVYQLARALGVRLNAVDAFETIIQATPSADLWGVADQHNDEGEIGNYLRVKGYPYYSYVDANSNYRTVGLIERVSRFLDTLGWDEILFNDNLTDRDMEITLLPAAYMAEEFKGIATADVKAILLRARVIERTTRHKLNPNCPALTTRKELVVAGALTNTLPV